MLIHSIDHSQHETKIPESGNTILKKGRAYLKDIVRYLYKDHLKEIKSLTQNAKAALAATLHSIKVCRIQSFVTIVNLMRKAKYLDDKPKDIMLQSIKIISCCFFFRFLPIFLFPLKENERKKY